MGERFRVVGDDDVYEIVGDVMGDVMGDDDFDDEEVGRSRRRGRGRVTGVTRVPVQRPAWRDQQLAPGVVAPGVGLLPLPLTGQENGGVFDINTNRITFVGQIQKPFQGERLLVSTVRQGVSAVGRLIAQLYVGTDLQQGDITGFDLEQVGDPQAFGVRLMMAPATPGVFLRVVASLNVPLTATDRIITTVTVLGQILR
jgi:hypothetical protein